MAANAEFDVRIEGDVHGSQIAVGHHIVQIGAVAAGAQVTISTDGEFEVGHDAVPRPSLHAVGLVHP